MSRASIAGTAALLLALGGATAARAQVPVDVTGVTLDNARLVNGVLKAAGGTVTGTIDGLPFTTDIRQFALDLTPTQQPGGGCPVLDLQLAPIHLALLGLHVDTSRICLDITANGEEGILGQLLCGLTGGNLGGLLNGLLGANPLLDGNSLLSGILEGVLGDLLDQAAPGEGGGNNGNGNGNGNGGNGRVCRGDCEVLHLVLGPVALNLLGLEVDLDNCRGGPVEVCVSATAGEGLLGSLLCGLADGGLLGDLLDNLNLQDILDLTNLAQDLLEAGVPPLDVLGQLLDFLQGLVPA